ncbi:MAG: ATP-binding protein [Candidatus Bathyarchaeota archaeon]|nr:ATP-binding protein [Candidatus Bathyarchaeota archaeon]
MSTVQYLIGCVLSLCVTLYILLSRPKTKAMKSLLLFGVVTTLWEAAVFLKRGAPDVATATNYFIIIILTSHLSFPLLLYTFLNLQEKRRTKHLWIFLPLILQLAIMSYSYFDNYEVYSTELDWSYRVVTYEPTIILVSVIFIGYLIGTFIVLSSLTKKTKLPLLKKKYRILLASFTLFQAIGTTVTNALLAFNLIPPSFRIGGVLQFLTFLSIWYALRIKEKEIPQSILQHTSFSQIYSSFLTIFYNSTIDSQLGEKVIKFNQFLAHSKIEHHVSFTNDTIVFNEGDDLDLVALITRNLDFFDKNLVVDTVVDHYLRIIKVADQKLDWRFEPTLKTHEAFLKKSDLIYGLSHGAYLEKITGDNSLQEFDDIDACLKLYKRILLPIMDTIQTNTDIREQFSRHPLTKALTITDYGEISLNRVTDQVLKTPKAQRLPFIIGNFNPILSQIYENVLSDPNIDNTKMLETLRLVLTLNREKATDLGVYPTLLGTLATKIPRTQIYKLYSDYLEEMVQEKTKALEEAQEKLLDTQRLAVIGEAAAMVGHDLRNPLQVITYALYFVEKTLHSSSSNVFKETCGTIKEQVKYMNKIVSDLQDYARPLTPKLVETNLPELLNETLSTLKISNTVQVSLVIADDVDPLKLMIDALMMKRVFINLITNALQAMPKGGQLTISVITKEETAVISIQDTGVGISEEQMSKLFQPLFTTKAKGQGLGLTVCKRLVEANDGLITFSSKLGVGSTFTVTLPLILNTVADKQEVSQAIVQET